jgi:hypothetical protein
MISVSLQLRVGISRRELVDCKVLTLCSIILRHINSRKTFSELNLNLSTWHYLGLRLFEI